MNAVRETIEKHWARQLEIPLEEVQQKALIYPCNKAPDGSPRESRRMIKRGSWKNRQMISMSIQPFLCWKQVMMFYWKNLLQ